jgi:uncharacterized membrane protein YfcA
MSFLIGLIAGVFGGLVGIGGGVLMIPLMVNIQRLGQHKAHGTSLVALVFTGIIGSFTYALHNSVDLWAAFLLATAALWPARIGAKYCCDLPEIKLKKFFGVFLIFISIFILSKPYLPVFFYPVIGVTKSLVLIATGAVTGFLSGLMGVGGGGVMIGGMVLLAGFDQHLAQGSSLLAIVPAGIVGAFTHWRMGNVEKGLLKGLIPGIVLGTFSGGSVAHLFPEVALRIIFAAVLIWMGGYFIKNPAQTCDTSDVEI